jgi:hypothetical protein
MQAAKWRIPLKENPEQPEANTTNMPSTLESDNYDDNKMEDIVYESD